MSHTLRVRLEATVISSLSGLLLLASWFKWLPLDFTESLGFATGALCVWLVTRENIWNWPIGLANNVFFAVLFWETRLYADLGLQAIYFALGLYGWWKWLYGGKDHSHLRISPTNREEWLFILFSLPMGTWGLHALLVKLNGSAPFLDAFTTMLCLIAQYLLCKKKLENWYLWIVADTVYIPLYLSKKLPLTACLYAGFIVLCVIGLRRWRKESAVD